MSVFGDISLWPTVGTTTLQEPINNNFFGATTDHYEGFIQKIIIMMFNHLDSIDKTKQLNLSAALYFSLLPSVFTISFFLSSFINLMFRTVVSQLNEDMKLKNLPYMTEIIENNISYVGGVVTMDLTFKFSDNTSINKVFLLDI